MSFSRSLVSLAGGLLLLGACASTGNTLAQDIAWDAFKHCQQRFPDWTLKRIDLDGTIWVGRVGGNLDQTNWQNCIRSYYADLAAKKSEVTPPRIETAVVSPSIPEPRPVLAPIWKRGDEWAFRWESPRGHGTFVWSIAGEEVIDGVEHYVLRHGREREALFTKPDLAWHIDKDGGVVTARAEPPQLRCKWPLTVGTEWEQQVTTERPIDRTTDVKIRSCRVETEESVTVPAGSFRTFKIVCRNKQTDETIHQYWYAPEVKNMVKEWSRFPWGVQERELIGYKLK